MRAMRALLAAVLLIGVVAGCTVSVGPASVTDPSPEPSRAAPIDSTTSTALIVDASIEAVSASRPSSDALAALELCGVMGPAGVGIGQVAGMGLLPQARDAVRYVPLTGKEPEIQSDRPAWVISLDGEVVLPRGLGVATDPTCVVIDGVQYLFMTGPFTVRGQTTEPLVPQTPPDLLLPPLAP